MGPVYAGRVYNGITAGLAARLVAGSVAGYTGDVVGIADCVGALRVVFTVLIIWFKAFLALKYSVYTLIQQRP